MTKNLFALIALTFAIPNAMANDLPARVTVIEGQVTELSSRIQKLEGQGDKAWSCLSNCSFYSRVDANTITRDGEPIEVTSNGPTWLEAWQSLQKTCEDARLSNKKDFARLTKVLSYETATWMSACEKN
jgi:hypothetical protein